MTAHILLILVRSQTAPTAASSFLMEFTNQPVCAAEERDLLIEAQPPLLEKEGNVARFNYRLIGCP